MSTVKANDITNVTGGIPTVKSQQLIPTAWVNFNGTGTVAIRDSEGVSSITDLAVGKFTVDFTTTMASVNYCVQYNTELISSWDNSFDNVEMGASNTSSVRVSHQELSNFIDSAVNMVIVMGGQS